MAKAKSPVPEGFHTVTPQLGYDEAGKAIDWYKNALGADEIMRSLGLSVAPSPADLGKAVAEALAKRPSRRAVLTR